MSYLLPMVTVANHQADNLRNLPAAAADGLSVAELLEVPRLAGATVLAGGSGLDRVVRGVSVLEVPDILPWVKPEQLLLSTAFALRPASDADQGKLLRLIEDLNSRQLSGLAVQLGADVLPAQVIKRADELGFPILRLPDEVVFDEVLANVFGLLLDRQNQVLTQSDALHQAIANIVLGGGGLPQIADEVSRLLDCVLLITTPDGRVLAEEGAARHRQAVGAAGLVDSSGRFLIERLRIGLLPALDDEHGGRAAMTSIVAGGVDHGRIVAYRQQPLPPGTVQALERVAIVAALTITKELAVAAVEGKFRGDYLRDVLTGQVAVDDLVVQHCRTLGWDIDRPMVVLVAELDAAESSKAGVAPAGPSVVHRSQHERFVSAWQQVLRARDKAAPVVGFSHEVVALLPARSGDQTRMVAELIAAVSGDRGGGRQSFSAGVSRRVLEPSRSRPVTPGPQGGVGRPAGARERRVYAFRPLGVLPAAVAGARQRGVADLRRRGARPAGRATPPTPPTCGHPADAAGDQPQRRGVGPPAALPLQHDAVPDQQAGAAARALHRRPDASAERAAGAARRPDARDLRLPIASCPGAVVPSLTYSHMDI